MAEPKKTVVLFDDSPLVLEAVEAALVARGFLVRAAETIGELDRLLASSTPDLFVLDVQMPEAFGDDVGEVLRVVRKYEAPILLYSSVDSAELARRVEAAKLDGYASKDEGVDVLVNKVVELLGP